jgi:Dynein heavy chain, N-terminal region 1
MYASLRSTLIASCTIQHMTSNRDKPPLSTCNLPPTANALAWCRGLQHRVHQPMLRMRNLDTTALQADEVNYVNI